jgi:hypothetical protein
MKVTVFPNPSSSTANVRVKSEKRITSVHVTDLKGTLVYLKSDFLSNEISLYGDDSVQQGTYLISLGFEDDSKEIKRLVINE